MPCRALALVLAAAAFPLAGLHAQAPKKKAGGPGGAEREAAAIAEPFKGITANGTVERGLFAIKSTGVSTEPVRKAAVAFLAALTPEQRAKTTFPVDDPEWRRWSTVALYAAAMAWVEAALVYYLRTHFDRIEPYQPNPLPITDGLGAVELVRELATLIMLFTVGALAGKTWRARAG